jgi:hypothetical protein
MIKTSRIASGFDIELQVGSGWFRTAIDVLNDNGLLAPSGVSITITNVLILLTGDWSLQIDTDQFPDPILIALALIVTPQGTQLQLTPNVPGIPKRTVPFDALDGLSGTPILVRLDGDADHEPVIAFLGNLDIMGGPQDADPGPAPPHGTPAHARSFLPRGKNVAFGMGSETFSRLANDIWHSQLRADDGTHPLPDESDRHGEWSGVRMTSYIPWRDQLGKEQKIETGKLYVKLSGDAEVDWAPDPHVTVTLLMTPALANGRLHFAVSVDTDIDTGILGDILGGFLGSLVFGLFGIPGLVGGFVTGVVVLEIAEVVVEGKMTNVAKARFGSDEISGPHCCGNGIVQLAVPGDGFLGILQAIPSSIAVHTQNPANEPLYRQSRLVQSLYDEFKVDSNGFGVAGSSAPGEGFQPEVVSLVTATYDQNERLESLEYARPSGQTQVLQVAQVIARTRGGELRAPFKVLPQPPDSGLRIPEGQLACVCLTPVAIRRRATVVEWIEFASGVRLKVSDTIALQDAAAVFVQGYELIRPYDDNPYYRAKADSSKENNFESLPRF